MSPRILIPILAFVFLFDNGYYFETIFANKRYKDAHVIGDYQTALLWAEYMLLTGEKAYGKAHQNYRIILNNVADLHRLLGQNNQAVLLFQQSLALIAKHQGKHHPEYAIELNNLALLYELRQDYEGAEALYKEAINIYQNSVGEENLDFAKFLNNLSAVYQLTNKLNATDSLLNKSVEIVANVLGTNNPVYAKIINNQAKLKQAQGQYDLAVKLTEKALSIYNQTVSEEHPEVAVAWSNLTELYTIQERYEEAYILYKQTQSILIKRIHRYFSTMSEQEKASHFQAVNFPFQSFISFALKAQKVIPAISADVYNFQLATKALLLSSTIKARQQILSSGDSQLKDLYQEWQKHKNVLAKAYNYKESDIIYDGISKDSLQKITDDLEKALSRQSDAFAQAADTTLYTWQDVQNALKPGEAAIELIRFRWFNKVWTDTIYYAALIVTTETRGAPEMILLSNGKDLEKKHLSVYNDCRENKNKNAYRHYWLPIQPRLPNISKVYLSPDGVYNQINPNILYNGDSNKYLIDEIEIHPVTNTKEIIDFHKTPSTNIKAELFGYPAYNLDSTEHIAVVEALGSQHSTRTGLSNREANLRRQANFGELIGTKQEVKTVNMLLTEDGWQTNEYMGAQALEENVKMVQQPRVLHIATHGFFLSTDKDDFRKQHVRQITPIQSVEDNSTPSASPNPMLRSGLMFAGAASYLNFGYQQDIEDGILTAYEATHLNLDGTELVVLSACETGKGEIQNGEGVYGLQRAFKVAGAKTILMSLWQVDDFATQELMTTFYRQWLSHKDKRLAFREAQQQLRKKYKQPEYWGAFVMVGE